MIGIIGAMAEEVISLKTAMDVEEVVEIAGMSFSKGTFEGRKVVVVCGGIGKVNAAVCAQILIDRFHADILINTGIAGSLSNKVEIGDMVISTDAVHHDMDCTIFGDDLGQVPRMDTFAFPADKELRKKAIAANEKVNPNITTFFGRIASGDQFVADRAKKKFIVDNFGALCCEMEGVAIAQTAYLNKIPYVIIRSISDKADDSATMDYPEFEKMAIKHTIRLIKELITML